MDRYQFRLSLFFSLKLIIKRQVIKQNDWTKDEMRSWLPLKWTRWICTSGYTLKGAWEVVTVADSNWSSSLLCLLRILLFFVSSSSFFLLQLLILWLDKNDMGTRQRRGSDSVQTLTGCCCCLSFYGTHATSVQCQEQTETQVQLLYTVRWISNPIPRLELDPAPSVRSYPA